MHHHIRTAPGHRPFVSAEPLEGRRLFAAAADLSAAAGSATFKTSKAGVETATLKVVVTNAGPGMAKGAVRFTAAAVDGTTAVPFTVKPAAAGIDLKAGKSKVFTVKGTVPSGLAAGTYDPTVTVGTAGLKSADPSLANNVATFSADPITVAGSTGGTGGGYAFAHFHVTSHKGPAYAFVEKGTVTLPDGSPATYQYVGSKFSGDYQLAVSSAGNGGYDLLADFAFTGAAAKTLKNKTLTLNDDPAGAVGTTSVDYDYEDLPVGGYDVHLS